MSRMGRTPITVPDGVSVEVSEHVITVTGPKGTLSFTAPEMITVAQDENRLIFDLEKTEDRNAKAYHGMTRSLVQGMVTGVSEGFRRELEFQGVGYRGQCTGQKLTLNLGYSHPVEYEVPEDVQVSMPNQTHVLLESIYKQKVGQVAATIRRFRPPDAYKGKGIRYVGEQISLKEGKTVG